MIQNILIAVIIALVLALGYKTWEAHELSGKVAMLEQAKKHADETISTKDAVIRGWEQLARTDRETIDKLARQNAELVGQKQRVAEAAATTASRLAATRAQLDTANRQLTEARRTLYANDPTCAILSVSPVCSGVSDGLRSKWTAAQDAIATTAGIAGGVNIGSVRPDWRAPSDHAEPAGLAQGSDIQPDRLHPWLLLAGTGQRGAANSP